MSNEELERLTICSRIPKAIAEIKICGALTMQIREGVDFIKPTEEQRKNLKEMLCIDVEVFD